MSKYSEILSKIRDVISGIAPKSEVYLYGSRARGNSKKQSHWDILILLNINSITFDYEKRIIDALYDIEIETGEVISPLIYTKKDWDNKHFFTPLYENINRDGIRL